MTQGLRKHSLDTEAHWYKRQRLRASYAVRGNTVWKQKLNPSRKRKFYCLLFSQRQTCMGDFEEGRISRAGLLGGLGRDYSRRKLEAVTSTGRADYGYWSRTGYWRPVGLTGDLAPLLS